MEKNIDKGYLKIFTIGEGIVNIESGNLIFSDKETSEEKIKIPFIDLSLMNERREIGENLLGLDIETTDNIKLLFTNVEGLEVLQRAIDYCREEFNKM